VKAANKKDVEDLGGIGLCINCGKRVIYCGRPFTDEIPCPHCGTVNVYEESQQPVRIKAA